MKTTTQVTVTLPTDIVERLDSAAAREGRTRSNYLRRMLQMRTCFNPFSSLPAIQRLAADALKAGDHATHAAVHPIEMALVDLRARVAEAARVSTDGETRRFLQQLLSGADEVDVPG